MEPLSPEEIIEHLDRVIESLTNYDDCYVALDVAYTLRGEVAETLQVDIE